MPRTGVEATKFAGADPTRNLRDQGAAEDGPLDRVGMLLHCRYGFSGGFSNVFNGIPLLGGSNY